MCTAAAVVKLCLYIQKKFNFSINAIFFSCLKISFFCHVYIFANINTCIRIVQLSTTYQRESHIKVRSMSSRTLKNLVHKNEDVTLRRYFYQTETSTVKVHKVLQHQSNVYRIKCEFLRYKESIILEHKAICIKILKVDRCTIALKFKTIFFYNNYIFYYRHIRSPWISIEGKIRGEAAIRSMPTSKISNLLRAIDRLREGRVNIRDLDRRDINSINKLLESYGVHQ